MKESAVLFFYVDAFDPKLIGCDHTPFLMSLLRSSHYRAKTIENVLGYSFSIQSSMLSGKYPDESGFWLPYCYSPKDSPLLFKAMGRLGKLIPVDHVPRQRYALMTGLRAFLMRKSVQANNIPFSVIENFLFFPYYYLDELPSFKKLKDLIYRKNSVKLEYIGPPRLRGDSIYDGLLKQVGRNGGSKLVVAYDDRLDGVAHSMGPSSEEYNRTARHIDKKLEQLHRRAKSSFKDFNLIVFSDHAQCDLLGSIDIISDLSRSNLRIGKDYVCFVDATLALFWPRTETAEKRIVALLQKLRIGTLVDDRVRKKYHLCFKDMEQYGHMIYVLRPGWSFFPNYFSPSEPMSGLHGYMPDEQVQKAFIIMDNRLATTPLHVKNMRDVFLECSKILE